MRDEAFSLQAAPLLEAWPGGRVEVTEAGPVLRIERRAQGSFRLTRCELERELTLVRGIGPVQARRLRAAGYADLHALARHPRWGAAAAAVLAALAAGDAAALRRAGAPPEGVIGLFPAQRVAFLDIETVGLARVQPVFLAGLLTWRDGTWVLTQWLARTFEEEAALLRALLKALEPVEVLLTYNGRAFDEPHIAARLAVHGCPRPHFACHADLLAVARRRLAWERAAGLLPDLRLRTVAASLLGQARDGDVDGMMVPELYWAFVRTQDPQAIGPVVAHNAADVAALARLLARLGLAEAAWEAGGLP